MSLIKKVDVPKHFAARRVAALAAARPAIKLHTADVQGPIQELDAAKDNPTRFTQDFSLEHSLL